MKKIILIVLILACCDSNKCLNSKISVFTHYQINQGVLEAGNKEFNFDIYDKPGGNIIFNLPSDEESGWEIEIEDKKTDYFKVANIWSQEYVKSKGEPWVNIWKFDWMSGHKFVWIKKGSVGLNTQNFDGEIISLHSEPENNSKVIGTLYGAQTVKVLDICGEWSLIEGKGKENTTIEGWLSPVWQCSNPLTTCN